MVPSADEIFEGDKQGEKIWLLLKQIFDIFALHDVTLLMPKIVKWINNSLQYFPQREFVGTRADDLYLDFKNGVNLACIIFMYV